VRCVMQPQRKRESEATREAMPIVYRVHVINFAYAIQRLFNLRDALGFALRDDDDIFTLTDGSSPSANWVGAYLKRLARVAIPYRLAALMDYTNHCLRRGGALANDVNDVPVCVQERTGAWAPGSTSRPLYVARIMERQAKAQYNMADTPDVTILQDDVGFADTHSRNPAFSDSTLDTERLDSDDEDEEVLSWEDTLPSLASAQPDTVVIGAGLRFDMGSVETEFTTENTVAPPAAKRARGRPKKPSTIQKEAAAAKQQASLLKMQTGFASFFTTDTQAGVSDPAEETDAAVPTGTGAVSEHEDTNDDDMF
jgi:hypothetical protein